MLKSYEPATRKDLLKLARLNLNASVDLPVLDLAETHICGKTKKYRKMMSLNKESSKDRLSCYASLLESKYFSGFTSARSGGNSCLREDFTVALDYLTLSSWRTALEVLEHPLVAVEAVFG